MKQTMDELATTITDSLNIFANTSKEFNESMASQHRTHQQSFTRMCVRWLRYVASNEYRFDGRNEASHELATRMIGKEDDFYLPII